MHYENYTSASTEAHKFFAGAKRPKGRAPQASGVRLILCALITKTPRMNSPSDSFGVFSLLHSLLNQVSHPDDTVVFLY